MFTRRTHSFRGIWKCALLPGTMAVAVSLTSARFARAFPSNLHQVQCSIAFFVASTVSEYEPIDITADDAIIPGQPLSCTIELTGGPSNVTITSEPPGFVSFNGMVPTAKATIHAATSASATGIVTIYAVTDGETVVSTTVAVRGRNNVPDPHPSGARKPQPATLKNAYRAINRFR